MNGKLGEVIREKAEEIPILKEAGTYQSLEYSSSLRCMVMILEKAKFIPLYQNVIGSIITFHEGNSTTYRAWGKDETAETPIYDEKILLRIPYGLTPGETMSTSPTPSSCSSSRRSTST